ncbi:MAG: hypothetical protein KatS3mg011_2252 [Acidimicrobiia bacterium]|nr:MAG: hypothetical protein KatS3mg011_2252 [Acidimicrobiia bacterium]
MPSPDRREEILGVATELFSRRGYSQTSLADIGRRVGISGPALYHYFESKAAILFEIRMRIVEGMLQQLTDLHAAIADPVALLDRVLRCHVNTLLDNRAANIVYERDRGLLAPAEEKAIRQRGAQVRGALARHLCARGRGWTPHRHGPDGGGGNAVGRIQLASPDQPPPPTANGSSTRSSPPLLRGFQAVAPQ